MATVEVRSDRNPDVIYEVDVEAGTCTCPHYTQKLKFVNEEKSRAVGYIKNLDALVCKHVAGLRRETP